MNQKKINRIRRGKKTRMNIRRLGKISLIVNKTAKHIYAQLVNGEGNKILAAVSTVQKDVASGLKYTGNVEAAAKVGKLIGEKAKSLGIKEIAFDRSGYPYHGRVKALAEAAREAGLKF